MSTIINPTVGRVMLYWPTAKERKEMPTVPGEPLAATVAGVQSEKVINVSVVDSNGNQFARTNVPVVQDGEDTYDEHTAYVTWMGYQIGQAKAQAEVEKLVKPSALLAPAIPVIPKV